MEERDDAAITEAISETERLGLSSKLRHDIIAAKNSVSRRGTHRPVQALHPRLRQIDDIRNTQLRPSAQNRASGDTGGVDAAGRK